MKEREPLPAALGHAQPNNRRQPTAYRLHSCLAMSASSFCLSTHKSPGYCWSTPKYGNWCAQHAFFEGKKLNKFLREKSTSRTLRGVDQQYPPGYCWRIYFTVLAVLFLASVSQAFLPSKKAYWAHQFRYLGVGQQYPPVISTGCHGGDGASETHTETQYNNQCRVRGSPESFWTA